MASCRWSKAETRSGAFAVLLAADLPPRSANNEHGPVGVTIVSVRARDPVVNADGCSGVPWWAVHQDVFDLHVDVLVDVAPQERLDLCATPYGWGTHLAPAAVTGCDGPTWPRRARYAAEPGAGSSNTCPA